eukprot:5828016-Pyramimonas_sp.AAC.1
MSACQGVVVLAASTQSRPPLQGEPCLRTWARDSFGLASARYWPVARAPSLQPLLPADPLTGWQS